MSFRLEVCGCSLCMKVLNTPYEEEKITHKSVFQGVGLANKRTIWTVTEDSVFFKMTLCVI